MTPEKPEWLLLTHKYLGVQRYCSATVSTQFAPFCGVPEDPQASAELANTLGSQCVGVIREMLRATPRVWQHPMQIEITIVCTSPPEQAQGEEGS